MQILNLRDIFTIIDELSQYLEDKDVDFDEGGFPIFREEMFLKDWPELVVPYSQRKNKIVKNPKRTLLCFFDKDHNLYPRLGKVLEDINEYKKFMGAIGLDITITEDMDEEWQAATCLLNQLFLAVLAVNNIKIVINTRTAGLPASFVFNNFPQQIMAASGFLGCDVIKEAKFNDNWKKHMVNLNDIVSQFTPGVKGKAKGVKYQFENANYIIKVDMPSGYLRIYDKNVKMYTTADGTPSRSREDTHFKIMKRKEMVR